MPDAMLIAMPGLDWPASFLYDGFVKFGMWDEMLKERAPNPQLTGATISYLQSRANALAATGKLEIELQNAGDHLSAVIRSRLEALARLTDAQFFYDHDRAVPLERRLEELKGIVYHPKIGTYFDKAMRLERYARELAPLLGADPENARGQLGSASATSPPWTRSGRRATDSSKRISVSTS